MADKSVVNESKESDKKRSKPVAQSSLYQFFQLPAKKQKSGNDDQPAKVASDASSKPPASATKDPPLKSDSDPTDGRIPDPIIPRKVPDSLNATWKAHKDCCLVRVAKEPSTRNKVAGFDLDGTLMVWRSANWPSRFEHYELWSSTVIEKLQSLHDDGYKLVIFTNQGGIQRALNGKKASFIKDVINWLAKEVDRPLHAVVSTLSLNKKQYEELSHHKPRPKMWVVAETLCNQKVKFELEHSFYVGDSATSTNDNSLASNANAESKPSGQDAVDFGFAKNVGELRGGTLAFHTPDSYFGPSDHEKRGKAKTAIVDAPPDAALRTRLALLGGYLTSPILLILCGVQGCGKSTFCQQLLSRSKGHWVHLSQDTINNGKPGKREKVEQEALRALEEGHSVVIDRTNLDPGQRAYFVEVARSARCPAHAVLLNPSADVVKQRVAERTNHPAGVEGDQGVRLALSALSKLVLPKYSEGFDLISCTGTVDGAARISSDYRILSLDSPAREKPALFVLANGLSLPSITLGTYKLGKRNATDMVQMALKLGFQAVDTAPTYNNEKQVGSGLGATTYCIVKIPLRAVLPEQVRAELQTSLTELNKKVADLVLLHWPSNVMSSGTLQAVWGEMEKCQRDGLCKALGVSNFNVCALATLLPHCSIRPVVNQVERHPLLAQPELLDYCTNQDILIQAHTALGGGNSHLLQHPVIQNVAKETSMSAAQVTIQWNLQQGVAVVVKCSTESHMRDILNSKVLSPQHIKSLDKVSDVRRFVAPPFMYGKAVYAWGDAAPGK